MREYWFLWLVAVFIIAAYMLGQNDNTEDIVTGCEQKQQFVVDGVEYTCYSFN